MAFLSFPALPKTSSLGCLTQSPLGVLLVASQSLNLVSSSNPNLFSDPVTFTATYTLSVSDTVTFTTLIGGTTGTLGTASMAAGVAALTTTTLPITQFFYPGIGGELVQAHLSGGVTSGILVQQTIYPQRLVIEVSFEINGFPFDFPLELAIVPNDVPLGVEGDVAVYPGTGATGVLYWSSTFVFQVGGAIGDVPGEPGNTLNQIIINGIIVADASSAALIIFIQPEGPFGHANFSQLWTPTDGQPWQNVRGEFSYVGPHSPTAELAPLSESMHVAIDITGTGNLSEVQSMTASGTVS